MKSKCIYSLVYKSNRFVHAHCKLQSVHEDAGLHSKTGLHREQERFTRHQCTAIETADIAVSHTHIVTCRPCMKTQFYTAKAYTVEILKKLTTHDTSAR